ncbi:hypothetical protein CkaCkLH20_07596 [Colletotrichum karsti]|uniref:AB hydrolase-1 domain-containing protein n=1 Tax=Colletotrichum karsti TaxID=1095194 RepID=A0A9P6I0V5_9PEZI|nr:uncharacterized protein CkaCkLH20_07596 [Colletotrichum karsti]KAF9874902.1 hypothetical protein CkaCkLH20_07596 [Colletotrichum karsti]
MTATKNAKPLGIVFVHGGFHQSSCFDVPRSRLEAAGFSPIIGVNLPSVGTNPDVSVEDDARQIRHDLAPHLDEGKEFLAIAHSYGGTPTTIAAKGLSVSERAADGKKGGVRAVVYVTANMPAKKGASALSVLPPIDIVDVTDDGLVTANAKAKAVFYGPDMADELAEECMASLLPQSQKALFGGVSVGVEELSVPAYYILCEKDKTIPVATQEEIISSIPTLREVLRNPGGHSAFITEVDTFVGQIEHVSDDVEKRDGRE